MGFESLADGVNRACADSIGIPATWTPRGSGSPVPLRAIFRRNHATFDPELGVMVTTTNSSAWVRSLDLPREPLENDLFDITPQPFLGPLPTAYLVTSIEPDGEGGIVLVLQKRTA